MNFLPYCHTFATNTHTHIHTCACVCTKFAAWSATPPKWYINIFYYEFVCRCWKTVKGQRDLWFLHLTFWCWKLFDYLSLLAYIYRYVCICVCVRRCATYLSVLILILPIFALTFGILFAHELSSDTLIIDTGVSFNHTHRSYIFTSKQIYVYVNPRLCCSDIFNTYFPSFMHSSFVHNFLCGFPTFSTQWTEIFECCACACVWVCLLFGPPLTVTELGWGLVLGFGLIYFWR